MCLQAQGIDNDNGVGIGRGIEDASKGSETTAEAARYRGQAQEIYNDNGGVNGER